MKKFMSTFPTFRRNQSNSQWKQDYFRGELPSVMVVKLTQGGADGFIEAKVETNADETTRKAMVVKKILLDFAQGGYVPETDSEVNIQVNMTTNAALLALDDPNHVHQFKMSRLLTTSGTFETHFPINIMKEFGLLVVGSRQFYLCLDTTGTQTLTLYLKILYVNKILSVAKWEKSY